MKLEYFGIFLKHKDPHLKNMNKTMSDLKVVRHENFPWKFRVLENTLNSLL